MVVAFGLPDDVQAGALLLYANGREPHFVGEHIHFTLPVASSEGPDVYFGFAAFAKDALGSGAGVTVLGGFNTRLGADESAEYLFVRGS